MNRWMYGSALIVGFLVGALGLSGCSSKVDTKTTQEEKVGPSPSLGGALDSIGSIPRPEAPTGSQPAWADGAPPQFATTEERYHHALSLHDQGDYEGAEREFEIVCEAWPKFSKPFKNLARTQIKLEKLEEALENVRTAGELNPSDGSIDNVRGLVHMEMSDDTAAAAAFESAIEKSPGFAWAYNNLGYLRIRQKDFGAAREILERGSHAKNPPSALFNNLGMALEQTGDTAASREAYARSVGKDPASRKAAANLSRLESLVFPASSEQLAQVEQ